MAQIGPEKCRKGQSIFEWSLQKSAKRKKLGNIRFLHETDITSKTMLHFLEIPISCRACDAKISAFNDLYKDIKTNSVSQMIIKKCSEWRYPFETIFESTFLMFLTD